MNRVKSLNQLKKDYTYQDQVYCQGEFPKMVPPARMKETLHANIGTLTFRIPHDKKIYNGTAFLISKNIIATVAHNVYSKKNKTFHIDFKFCPGAFETMGERYDIESKFIPQEYRRDDQESWNVEKDFALLKLKGEVYRPQYLTLCVGFDNVNEKIAIYGYPGNKFIPIIEKEALYEVRQFGLEGPYKICLEEAEKQKTIKYELSTSAGQSGCPIVIGTGIKNIVIGIHKGGSVINKINFGRLITIDLLIDFQVWREKCKGAPFKAIHYRNNKLINFQQQIVKQTLNLILKQRKTFKKEKQHFQLRMTMILPEKEKKNQETSTSKLLIQSISYYSDFWDMKTPYVHKYLIDDKKIVRNSSDGTYQIISAHPLESESQTAFIVHQYGEYISLGITTEARRNQLQSGGLDMQGSIGYWTDRHNFQGNIVINGINRLTSPFFFIKMGSSLKMRVSQKAKSIRFSGIYQQPLDFQLPKNMYGKELYVYASLSKLGDYIEIK